MFLSGERREAVGGEPLFWGRGSQASGVTRAVLMEAGLLGARLIQSLTGRGVELRVKVHDWAPRFAPARRLCRRQRGPESPPSSRKVLRPPTLVWTQR